MRIIWIGMLMLLFLNVQGQRTCGTDGHHEHQMQTSPEYAKKYNKWMAKRKANIIKRAGALACGGTTVVPVAVHFNNPINCDDWECLLGAVEAQIEVMNEDFSATNADIDNYYDLNSACASNYPLSTLPDEGDGACIQFCLASMNHPSGTGLQDGDPAITVGEWDWPVANDWDGYLNIFVSNSVGGLGISPLFGDADGDGFWVTHTSFGGPGFSCNSGGNINTSGTYGLGRTATHEAGHYFGLNHVFGSCGNPDGIADTPPQQNPIFGNPIVDDCGDSPVQCGGEPCSFFSFMDYTDDEGMVMFTAGQSDEMDSYAGTVPFISDATVCGGTYGAPACAMINLPLALELLDTEDVTCNGDNDGTIEVEATGGDGTYTYELNGGSSNMTGVFTGLSGGTYTITVIDGNGNDFSIEVEVIEPDVLEVELIETVSLTCFDSADGVIEIEIDGGTPGYDVELNGSGFGDDTFFDGLEANTYEILVEDDNGCEQMIEVIVEAPDTLYLNLVNQIAPSCGGYDDGMVELIATGGTVTANNYGYSSDGVTFQDSPVFDGLTAGSYTFMVEDENGCLISLATILDDPEPILIEITDSNESVSCAGDTDGFVSLEGSNTSGPYTYSLDGMNYSDSGDFMNLTSGTYTFYVQDADACVGTIDVEIEGPDPLELDIELASEISCNSAGDGVALLSGFGGTSDYSYFLEDLNTPVTDMVENLGVGTYMFIVQDINGCLDTNTVVLTEPDPINIQTNEIIEVECFGDETGSASFSASGGNGNFEYEVDGTVNTDGMFMDMTSGTYVLNVTDNNDCTQELIFDIGQTSDLILDVTVTGNNACAGDLNGAFTLQGNGGVGTYQYSLDGVTFNDESSFTGLPGGIYDVFVIDDNDCITVSSATIEEPEPIALEANEIGGIMCYNDLTGIITINAAGGAEGYMYNLNNDINDTGIFMNLGAGSYLIEVTDQNGCSNEVEYTLEEPEEILPEINQTNNTCEGQMEGTLNVSASGGTGTLTYQLGTDMNTTGVFENLAGDFYELIVSDENGCTFNEMISIQNDINLILNLDSNVSPTCNDTEDGSIVVSADGGNGDYMYTLETETNATGSFENLAAGTYTVMVEDPFGCSTTLEVDVMATPLIDLANAEISDVLCNGEASGSVNLDAGGGSGMLSFTLDGSTNTTGEFDGLAAGEYILTVMDENMCETTSMITIDEPLALEAVGLGWEDVQCFGDATGMIDLSAAGGVGQLTFSLSGQNDNTTGVFTDLPAGSYDVIITDENNCSINQNVNIEQPEEILSAAIQLDDVDCFEGDNGAIEISTSGGTGDYMYSLNGQESTEGVFVNLSAGNYSIMVTDDIGCSSPFNFEIVQPDALLINSSITDAGVEELGSIDLELLGGTEPYVISLSDGTQANADDTFTDLEPGFYTVEVTDDNGCFATVEVEIRLIDLYDDQPDGITLNESICPNPTRDWITVKFESTSDQNVIFEFYDDEGKYIGDRAMFALTGANEMMIDVRDFTSSTYIMKILAERQEVHLKFVKVD